MKKIKNWFIGEALAETEDVFVRAKIELLFSYTFIYFILGFCFYIYLFVNNLHYHFYLISLAILTLGSVPFILKFTRNLKLTSNCYIIQQTIISAGSVIIQQGEADFNGGLWLMVTVLFAFFLYKRIWAVVILVLYIFLLGIPAAFKDQYYIPPSEKLGNLPEVFMMPLILNVYVVWMFMKTSETAQRKINDQKNMLEEKNKEVLDSIRYAKRIQNSLMTSEKYIERVLRDMLGKK